jgi:hypothetical protein
MVTTETLPAPKLVRARKAPDGLEAHVKFVEPELRKLSARSCAPVTDTPADPPDQVPVSRR